MKKEEIFLTDIKRILFGNAPIEFLIEVFLRTLIIYLFLLVVLRLLGKRMDGQITIMEMAVMVMLGAIVSPAMQMPERGLIAGIFILVLTMLFHRGISYWSFKNEKAENIMQGKVGILVKDGIIQLDELEASRVTRQQLYAVIRAKKIYNLAHVKRLYIEACGKFSVIGDNGNCKNGLSLFPPKDEDLHMQKENPDMSACCNCGNVIPKENANTPCLICKAQEWIIAVID